MFPTRGGGRVFEGEEYHGWGHGVVGEKYCAMSWAAEPCVDGGGCERVKLDDAGDVVESDVFG